ncbi:MAG: acyloxyacyl hydrolase [Gammaproteobacteria bacterium]|nr:acyloxyacyl hydrolase [Gammaproteobacteria bacterium]
MTKINFYRALLFILLGFNLTSTYAWDHSVELGAGKYHDPNNVHYDNSGLFLSGDIIGLKRTFWTFWSLTGALGQWQSTAPENKNLTTAALSLALRFYPFNIADQFPAYLLGSVGPAYLSSRKFGTNTQASNLTIQTNLGLGAEFNQYDINLRLVHFSNANLGNPNEGFNFLFMLSLGYLF